MSRNQGHVEIRFDKNEQKFITRNVAENGRILAASGGDVLGTKGTALNNLHAQLQLFGGGSVIIWDFTTYDQENPKTEGMHDKVTLWADGSTDGYRMGVYAPKGKRGRKKKDLEGQ